MSRALFALLLLLCGVLPALADGPARIMPRPLTSALDAAADGRWSRAAALAARDGPVAVTLIDWMHLRAGDGTVPEVLAFLGAHPDWPGLDRMRANSAAASEGASDADVLAFYKDATPQTGEAVLRYAKALSDAGQLGDAEASVVLAWRTLDLTTQEHNDFLNAWGPLLAPHHDARMDMALWRGLKDAALMLPLVSDDMARRAEIRMAGRNDPNGIEARILALPKAMQQDGGIAHVLFDRYIDTGKADKAMALMQRQSKIAGGLGEAWRWAGWRRSFARRMMRDGDYARAYDLAANHQLTGGAAYADLEWLSGYLALRFLGEPALALDHFQRFRAEVNTPISLGRADYWIGRAQDALGDPEAAQIAYAQGATQQTSFYGQLAAEKAGLPSDPALAGGEVFPPWQDAAFAQGDLFQAIALLAASGQLTMAEWFTDALAERLDRTGLGQLGAALSEMGRPHLQVMLGKAAARRGIVLPGPYYALHPMKDMDLPVPREMALAIARRESEFDHLVASGAGALGLMQLLPGTAADVARDLGLPPDRVRVLRDWRFNARLGSTYLSQLARRFDGNVVLIAAGYNAGPTRPAAWMAARGDPRTGKGMGDLDVIDWIEFIPFDETRNYVQRVAESLPIYRARLGLPPHPVPFSKELTGATVPSIPGE